MTAHGEPPTKDNVHKTDAERERCYLTSFVNWNAFFRTYKCCKRWKQLQW